MDGIYLPNGRQLSLIDRDWILDELPHLGNPDNNSDANYLVASVAVANSGTSVGTGGGFGTRTTSNIGTTGGGSGSTTNHTATGNTGSNHQNSGTNHNHNLSYNSDEFESDLTLLSEIVDETQNKWSDFGLNQLLTSYARTIPSSTFK